MRNSVLWVLLAVIVVIWVAIWNLQPGTTVHSLLASTASPSPASHTSDNEARTGRRRVGAYSGRYSGVARTNEPAATTVAPPPKPGPVAAAPTGVPDPEKMAIGTTSSELRKRFGVPSLAVESVDDGSLLERYYYVKPDRAHLVVATLRNGTLVSAQNARIWQPQQNFATKREWLLQNTKELN